MKKSKDVILLIAPILGGAVLGCGGGETFTTRDVYQNRADCIKDWGEGDLCSEMNDDDSNEYKRRGGTYSGGTRPIWGPHYNLGDRAVSYKGRTIAPTSRSSSMPTFRVGSRSSSSSSRSSVSTPRGGFGGSSSSSSS